MYWFTLLSGISRDKISSYRSHCVCLFANVCVCGMMRQNKYASLLKINHRCVWYHCKKNSTGSANHKLKFYLWLGCCCCCYCSNTQANSSNLSLSWNNNKKQPKICQHAALKYYYCYYGFEWMCACVRFILLRLAKVSMMRQCGLIKIIIPNLFCLQ